MLPGAPQSIGRLDDTANGAESRSDASYGVKLLTENGCAVIKSHIPSHAKEYPWLPPCHEKGTLRPS